jgi:type IV pilus assembly protein PilN
VIRINLLPGARKPVKAAAAGGTQGWVIAYLVVGAIMVVILGFWYASKRRELARLRDDNGELQDSIQTLENEAADIEQVRANLERSRQLESVVNELQRARYGPTSVLMDLSEILSTGRTIDAQRLADARAQNPLATFNPSWDPRRLWLTEFVEEDRVCTIHGAGKTNEDVAEFLRRLSLSDRFEEVELVKTEGAEDETTHLPIIEFELTARVTY